MSDFNTRIIDEFRANEGRVGGPFDGAPMVLLHSRGAKTGEPRVTPLVSFPEADAWVIVASAGGQPKHPAWYHNLLSEPETQIEFGADTIPVRAEVVTEGRDELWRWLTRAMPNFQAY